MPSQRLCLRRPLAVRVRSRAAIAAVGRRLPAPRLTRRRVAVSLQQRMSKSWLERLRRWSSRKIAFDGAAKACEHHRRNVVLCAKREHHCPQWGRQKRWGRLG